MSLEQNDGSRLDKDQAFLSALFEAAGRERRSLTAAMKEISMLLSSMIGLFALGLVAVTAAKCSSSRPTTGTAAQRVDTSVPLQLGTAQAIPSTKAVKYANVAYAHVNGKDILLDLYLPADATKPLPCIVWIHGGGWIGGNKDGCGAVLPFVQDGYAVVSIDHRLTPEAAFPAQIHDCKGAIRFVRAHAAQMNIDPNRIGAWGESAGGHLVALLATTDGVKELEGDIGGNTEQSSRVLAACDWYGPSDVETFANAGKYMDLVIRLLGGPIEEHKALARLASPIHFVSKDAVPLLIMHGDADDIVLHVESQTFYDALKKANADVRLQIIKGGGHGTLGNDAGNVVREFFAKHMRKRA